MSFENHPEFARQVADLNRYGQALNGCESVEEVASLTIEAMTLLFEFPYATFAEARDGDLRVVHSSAPAFGGGDTPDEVARTAYETGETVQTTRAETPMPEGLPDAAMATPAAVGDEVIAVIVTRTEDVSAFDDGVVKPVEMLASHAATAVSNIRSRENLERARRDLEKRKEMVELYDQLLRHDIGNDLQVIAGFAEIIDGDAEGQVAEYGGRIQEAAESAAGLIEQVGDVVSALEAEREPVPMSLRHVLTATVPVVESQYDDLTVAFDPEAFDVRVYGGNLLESVFTNLVSNAAVHNEGPVTVQVGRTDHSEGEVTVTIADDGAGIDPEVREDLFEMGVKGPESEGTGFGLGLVEALVESYGGSVVVGESESGGAAFHVTLERA